MSDILKIQYDICDSTNTRAREYLRENEVSRAVFVANAQTNGRGRQGKSFYSPADTGVYMSYVFRADLPFTDAANVTTAAAAYVCSALESLCKKNLSVKWVNDIYLEGRKICGILAESVFDSCSKNIKYVIIGIGVNLCTEDFPSEIENIAGNLGFSEKEKVVDALLEAMNKLADNPCGREFMDYYRKKSSVIGKNIVCISNGECKKALALDVDDLGGLVVKYENGEVETLRSGEISIRPDV